MDKLGARITAGILALCAVVVGVTACDSDANVTSQNISTDADNFKILRRIVAINAITDKYLLTIEGWCSIKYDRADSQLEVTCKVDGGYKKDFVGISDNVTYTVEQMDAANVSPDHYTVVFKPETIIPTVRVR